MFLLFTYVFSFFFTNFSIKIHSPKRSTDYGTSLSQVTSEATSPSYPHFTSAPRNTFLERTKNKLHKKLFPWNSPASQRTLCRRIHAFSHFLQVHEVHEVHEVQSIAPPGYKIYKHKSIHINSQRIHSGTFHQFHSLKKIVWCFGNMIPKLLELSELRLSILGPGHGFRHLGEADQECRVPLRQPWRHFQMSKVWQRLERYKKIIFL